MSQLNMAQQFINEQLFRQQLTLNSFLNSFMEYLEYVIGLEFNASDKSRLKKKNRKRQIAKEFTESFGTLSREEKIQYYFRCMDHIKHFINGDFTPPKSQYQGGKNEIGFSRSFSVRRWKQKKLRLDLQRHILYAQRQNKIKTYDMRDYILRKSKNKQYHSFVLQAINTNPPQKSRTVHIGFQSPQKLNEWFACIKFSVQLKQWQFLQFLFKGGKSQSTVRVVNTDRMNTFGQMSMRVDNNPLASSMVDMGSTQNQQWDFKEEKKIMLSKLIQKPKKEPQPPKVVQKQKQPQIVQPSRQMIVQKQKLQAQIKTYQDNQDHLRSKTLIDQLMDGDVFQQPQVFADKIEDQDQASKNNKRNLDLFHRLKPDYQLQELTGMDFFVLKYQEANLKIYQNQLTPQKLKLVLNLYNTTLTPEHVVDLLSKPQLTKKYNDNIQQIQVKTKIDSQNSAIMYQQLKPLNRLYRSRDFVFIRHVFKLNNILYMVDKSIQHANHPPFLSIVRGNMCIVYGIFQKQKQIQILADVQISNQGYLNTNQTTQVTVKYLKGFMRLGSINPNQHNYTFLDYGWDLSKNKANQIHNQIRMRRNTLQQLQKRMSYRQEEKPQSRMQEQYEEIPEVDHHYSSPQSKKQPEVYSQTTPSPMKKKAVAQEVQVSKPSPSLDSPTHKAAHKEVPKPAKSQSSQLIVDVIKKLDAQGMVIVQKGCLKPTHRYILKPIPQTPKTFQSSPFGHPLWKDQWIHDDKQGALIFVHQKKLKDQKGVLSYILGKIAKNILSGQSILNISLPVDIFAPQSNIQRFLWSMLYGPVLLQGLENKTPVQKLVTTVVFGITNSVLYLSMEKPFNPILGQTFQCWINGCPGYSQQISHHPPIASLLFKGRGYDVRATLESKVSVSVNSATGSNDGHYAVTFADKTEICFITPGGEVTGLSRGDRKFNLVDKSYYWIQDKNIVLELVFDPFKKGFFSMGKAQQPIDYFQGTIWQVKPDFMFKFLGGKRKEPQAKERTKSFGKISGIWNKIFNFNKSYPLVLEYEANPLPSDANWRQDIEYRRRNQVTRAQTQKERLQVLQRKDKKMRLTYGKKKK